VGVKFRLLKAGVYAGLGLGVTALTGALAAGGAISAAPAAYIVALDNSVPPTTDPIIGGYSSPNMQIEVAIAPRNEAGLNSLLAALYDKNSKQYHEWLKTGQFDADFAPLPSTRQQVISFLADQGLKVVPSSSPFLVTARGSSMLVSGAFHTTLNTFKDPKGITYFSNSTSVWLPNSIAGDVLGVIGLTNTVRPFTLAQPVKTARDVKGTIRAFDSFLGPNRNSCETPYPTTAQLFNAVNNGVSFPYGYGGGPGCSGLTPSQTNSLYSAPHLGPRAQGEGVTLAVFELAAYHESDIDTWAHQFYGPGYTPTLNNISVDGGPLNPGGPCTVPPDSCPLPPYAGDVEVDADIEEQLALSPANAAIDVYDAPNDNTGATELDEYTKIADDNTASVVSSSWGVCEQDVTQGYALEENTLFAQMATQGQSMFTSSGDTGAFGCIRADGTTVVRVGDPAGQPYVTAVGGTSFNITNPGTNPHPGYKLNEAVWNVDNLCSNQTANAGNGGLGGLFWCGATGASGGGSSEFWAAPPWQKGPGVVNSNSTYGCPLTLTGGAAPAGSLCREVPDVSANADEYTGYAEYCTETTASANPVTGGGGCSTNPAQGWFIIGGTSLSSPLWSGIIADRDSWQGKRTGNAAAFLYELGGSFVSSLYFHDMTTFFHNITGNPEIATNNGLDPETSGYDEATGIGTPIMSALITLG
jgi:subtilase family serine protease